MRIAYRVYSGMSRQREGHMAATQMNIRIDSAVKSEGDLALAQAGYTPTQAVRLLWEYARRKLGDIQGLRELLASLMETDSQQKSAGYEPVADAADSAWQRRIDLYQQLGIPLPAKASVAESELGDALQAQVDADRLAMEEIYTERQAERGA